MDQESQHQVPLQVQEEQPIGTSGMSLYRATCAPLPLPEGQYQVRIVSDTSPLTSLQATLMLRDGVSVTFGESQGTPAAAKPTAQARAISERSWRAFRKSFREAVGLTSRGSSETAAKRLADAQRAVIGEDVGAVARLARVEKKEVRSLTRGGAQSLVPLIELFRDGYRHHWKNGTGTLASHNRLVAIELAEQFAKDSGQTQAAVALLINIALDTQRMGMHDATAEILEKCLQIDSTESAVLVTLAVLEEKGGNYDQVLNLLRRLIDSDPDHHAGRLRLAVNELRVGQSRRAEDNLRTIVAQAPDGWVLRVAYQELAREQLRRNRLDEAKEILEVALGRFPDDEKLHVQMAYLHEREDRPWKARAVLNAWRNRGLTEKRSPRNRYAQLPLGELASLRQRLHDQLEQGRQQLTATLGSAGASGGQP